MAYLLHIETSNTICSVAISDDNHLLSEHSSENKNDHASKITLLIQSALQHSYLSIKELEAVCVSAGPGSYTGLRIGASTAKGICHGLQIPLISVNTLQSMADAASKIEDNSDYLYCPMIDARRAEVYTAIYDFHKKIISEPEAVTIESNYAEDLLAINKIVFFGSGLDKSIRFLQHKNAILLHDFKQTATNLIPLAFKQYIERSFENPAYFEPFYLKDFYSGKPAKS